MPKNWMGPSMRSVWLEEIIGEDGRIESAIVAKQGSKKKLGDFLEISTFVNNRC